MPIVTLLLALNPMMMIVLIARDYQISTKTAFHGFVKFTLGERSKATYLRSSRYEYVRTQGGIRGISAKSNIYCY